MTIEQLAELVLLSTEREIPTGTLLLKDIKELYLKYKDDIESIVTIATIIPVLCDKTESLKEALRETEVELTTCYAESGYHF